jgi:hypothetical protein
MMTNVLRTMSLAAGVMTLLPSFLMLTGEISHQQTKTIMMLATVTWFAVTPFWMDRPPASKSSN